MNKLEAVQKSLEDPELRDWYKNQHGVEASDFNFGNINVFGSAGTTRGLGDLAGQILADSGIDFE